MWSCPAIRSLPKDGLLSSLQELEIKYCPVFSLYFLLALPRTTLSAFMNCSELASFKISRLVPSILYIKPLAQSTLLHKFTLFMKELDSSVTCSSCKSNSKMSRRLLVRILVMAKEVRNQSIGAPMVCQEQACTWTLQDTKMQQ